MKRPLSGPERERTMKSATESAPVVSPLFGRCFDEECEAQATVRMSINGVHVYLCTKHARHLAATR
jgi:hypothetical protein